MKSKFFLGIILTAFISITSQAQIEIIVDDNTDLSKPVYSRDESSSTDVYTKFGVTITSIDGAIKAPIECYANGCKGEIYLTGKPEPGSVTYAKVSGEYFYQYSEPGITGEDCHYCKGCGKAGHTPPLGGMHCIQKKEGTGGLEFKIIFLDVKWEGETLIIKNIGDDITLKAKGLPDNINGTYEWISDKRGTKETKTGEIKTKVRYQDEYFQVKYKYNQYEVISKDYVHLKSNIFVEITDSNPVYAHKDHPSFYLHAVGYPKITINPNEHYSWYSDVKGYLGKGKNILVSVSEKIEEITVKYDYEDQVVSNTIKLIPVYFIINQMVVNKDLTISVKATGYPSGGVFSVIGTKKEIKEADTHLDAVIIPPITGFMITYTCFNKKYSLTYNSSGELYIPKP